MSALAILGAGSWGTALAIALAPRFQCIRLWARDRERAKQMADLRENRRYLPGFRFPDQVRVSSDIRSTVEDADILLCVVPSRYLRGVLEAAGPYIPTQTRIVSATKGIEEGTLCRMSQVMMETLSCLVPACRCGSLGTYLREGNCCRGASGCRDRIGNGRIG